MSEDETIPDYPPARDYSEILYACNYCRYIVQGSAHDFQEHMQEVHDEYVFTNELGCYILNEPDPPEEIVRAVARGIQENFPFRLRNEEEESNKTGSNTDDSGSDSDEKEKQVDDPTASQQDQTRESEQPNQ